MKTVASKATNAANIVVAAVKTEPADALLQQFQNPNVVITNNNNTTTAAAAATNAGNKRPISLDLNKNAPAKKQRLAVTAIDSSELPSSNLPPNTPDLEKILLASNLLQTPQPGTVFPTKMAQVTSEQEAFGKGFEEALHSLHNSKSTQGGIAQQLNNSSGSVTSSSSTSTNTGTGTGFSGGTFTYTNLDSSYPVAVKDEPNASASPPVSPIDMETQEKIKLERKRQRNRVAASKCRKRKLERISKLEDKVKNLKCENSELGQMVKTLKDHVAQLKQQVIDHCSAGCKIYPDSPMQGK